MSILSLGMVSCGSLKSDGDTPTINSSSPNITGDTSNPSTTTLSIPTDYSTIQQALEGSEVMNSNSKKKIIISLNAGYRVPGQTTIADGDYSNVEIRCSGTISVSSDFPKDDHIFKGSYARMPILSCLIDMNSKGTDGIVLLNQSSGYIKDGAGIINAGRNAVNLFKDSHLVASGALFYGAGGVGVLAQELSSIQCRDCDASRAATAGFQANDGSKIFARGAIANNVGTYAFYAVRSSSISALEAEGISAGSIGAIANRTSTIDIDLANLDNAGDTGIYSGYSSLISAVQTSAKNAGRFGLRANGAASIATYETDVRNSGQWGALVDGAGLLYGYQLDATGSRNIQQNGTAASPYDIVVRSGGKVDATINSNSSNQNPAADRLSLTPNSYQSAGVIHR